jgi:AcrR family transcriptional regulator
MDKRELILRAALGVLRDEGLGSFSQARVAARAELRQSHLTYYFPTRADLLRAVAERGVAERIEALRVIETAGSADGKVRCLAHVLADPAQTRVLVALTQCADTDPGVREVFDALRRELAPISAGLVVSAGITPTPDVLALVQSSGTGIGMMLLATAPADAETQAYRMLSTLLTSLRTAQAGSVIGAAR